MTTHCSLRHFAALVLLAGLIPLVATSQASSAAPVEHTVEITGTGVSVYPEFAPETERYGVRTTAGTAGAVDVFASTSDPTGRVIVNGRPASRSVRVTGLVARDEVSVIFKDSLGTSVHSFIYLPSTFPTVTARVNSDVQEGHTLATLGTSAGETARYMTVLDENAVPRFLEQYAGNRHDFKQQPDGSYSVSSDTRNGSFVPERILRLNGRFEEVRTHSTVGLIDTDFHESKFLANGNVILMAYEPRNDGTNLVDSVIQEQNPDGDEVFRWSTEDHVDLAIERVTSSNDYAHLNSIEVMDDGDLLVSLRNISSVFKIARRAHDDYDEGEVIWRLGGRASTFDFVGDSSGGQCLQHTATQTNTPGEPVRVMVFDNGSASTCVDGDDPSGPPVARPFSRAVEYELDPVAATATQVFQYPDVDPEEQPNFGAVTGSAYRLANGNTLIGWGNNVAETASTEVNPAGDAAWSLENADDGPGNPIANYGSYRFHRATTRDAFVPEATIDVPTDGATFDFAAPVAASYGCTDTGGSSLVACGAPLESGGLLDTRTPGTRTFTVTARDGDGNTTSSNVTYTVLAAPEPPASPTPTLTTPTATIPPDPTATAAPPVTPPTRGPRPDAVLVVGSSARGDDAYGNHQRSRVRLTERTPIRTVRLRLENDGDVTSTLTTEGPSQRRGFRLRATHHGRDVTRALRRGTFRLTLAPGEGATLRLTLSRPRRPTATLRGTATFSVSSGDLVDVVQLRVTGA